ncbi:MAG: phage tail sheath C-terminal domain-containing protein [Rhodothermales bacterium]
MAKYKTPGVYITETSAFPATVVPVDTAVPAFVGYTERAAYAGTSLRGVPRRITSFAEYEACFGGSPAFGFQIEEADPAEADFTAGAMAYRLLQTDGLFLLHRCLRHFFANGGGACYIVSVGDYAEPIDAGRLGDGIAALERERDVTVLVAPETTRLDAVGSSAVHRAMLAHSGGRMKNRCAILDIRDGHRPRNDPSGDAIDAFRAGVGAAYLDFGAAYYPWLNTTVVGPDEILYTAFAPVERLQALLREELGVPEAVDPCAPAAVKQLAAAIADIASTWDAASPAERAAKQQEVNLNLLAISPLFHQMCDAARLKANLLPPAAAMAGLYTMVDNSRGVWKAPANVSLNAVVSPAVAISQAEQEDLNVDPVSGKSVNAIRTFIGQGVLVWGARTLDGNSADWRYINVRRTMLMVEESIRIALKAFVFEPNDANTWATVRSMISNFLTGIWKAGGLAGATPNDAFGVRVGLGETMTAQDILDGLLRVTVFVAITRPAEFIVLNLELKLTPP